MGSISRGVFAFSPPQDNVSPFTQFRNTVSQDQDHTDMVSDTYTHTYTIVQSSPCFNPAVTKSDPLVQILQMQRKQGNTSVTFSSNYVSIKDQGDKTPGDTVLLGVLPGTILSSTHRPEAHLLLSEPTENPAGSLSSRLLYF